MSISGGIPGNIDVGKRKTKQAKSSISVDKPGKFKDVICLDTFGCYHGLFREICHHCQNGTDIAAERFEIFPFVTYDASTRRNIPMFLPQNMADALSIQVAKDMHSDDPKLLDLSQVVFNVDGSISKIEKPVLDYKEVSYAFPTLQDFAMLYMKMQDDSTTAKIYTGKAHTLYTIRNVSVWPVVFFILIHRNVMEAQIDIKARDHGYDFDILAKMNEGAYEDPNKGRNVGTIRLPSVDCEWRNMDVPQGFGQSVQGKTSEGIRTGNPAAHPEVPCPDNQGAAHDEVRQQEGTVSPDNQGTASANADVESNVH